MVPNLVSSAFQVDETVATLTFEIRYPIVYCVLILPLTIVRWRSFAKKSLPGHSTRTPVQTFAVVVLFTLGGVFNAALYLLTRTSFFQPDRRKEPAAPVIKTTPEIREDLEK